MRGWSWEAAGWAHRHSDRLQIPILTEETAELLPNQCLVRYRGLVSPYRAAAPGEFHAHARCVHTLARLAARDAHSASAAMPGGDTLPSLPIDQSISRTVSCKQVQDMLNPEYYLGEFQRADGSWATAKFADQVCRCWRGASAAAKLLRPKQNSLITSSAMHNAPADHLPVAPVLLRSWTSLCPKAATAPATHASQSAAP